MVAAVVGGDGVGNRAAAAWWVTAHPDRIAMAAAAAAAVAAMRLRLMLTLFEFVSGMSGASKFSVVSGGSAGVARKLHAGSTAAEG